MVASSAARSLFTAGYLFHSLPFLLPGSTIGSFSYMSQWNYLCEPIVGDDDDHISLPTVLNTGEHLLLTVYGLLTGAEHLGVLLLTTRSFSRPAPFPPLVLSLE